MLPMVAIDMPPDWAPAAASTIVGRCERVLGPGQCVDKAKGRAAGATYFAVIRPDETEPTTRLQIELGRESTKRAVLSRRALVFAVSDPAESRWASLGLLVAGLVTAAEASEATAPAPLRTRDTPAPRSAKPAWHLGLDAGAFTGPGFERAWHRTGGFGRAWLSLPSAPHVVAVLGARYAVHPGEPLFQWATGSLGAGARLGGVKARWNAELLGEVAVERLFVSASHPEQGSESGGQTRFGGRLGLNVSLRLFEALRLVAGGEAETLSPPVRLEVRNAIAGREPPARFTLTAGLRLPL